MRIVQTRRISQILFFLLFLWFCIVSGVGDNWRQIRGWPVNWFIQLDPLVAIGTLLTTHRLFAPLLWAMATVVLTIVFGRFFCGWVCPFGSIHHIFSYWALRSKSASQKIKLNKYRKAQGIKYLILLFLLGGLLFPSAAVSLQTGLLDPIPLVTRSFNLVLLPVVDGAFNAIWSDGRFHQLGWLIFLIFLSAVLLNFFIPRFYCRFICPLGALFALLGRFAIWRIGKRRSECANCMLCQSGCQVGCEPAGSFRASECILCFNCLDGCKDGVISYQTEKSASGEVSGPDISRRAILLSLASGVLAVPAVRLANKLGRNWQSRLIRPPGALPEQEFLKRCIKCGQCMRICPTNVLQPAGIEGGLEGIFTPALNNRIGSSGCQLNCVACGQVCPTSAVRPIELAEKLGTGRFAVKGSIKIGTAFIDRSRCLPWAMDRACIVCQENCPVSPKAIFTREYFRTVRDGILTVGKIEDSKIEISGGKLKAGEFATGDYYCLMEGQRSRIVKNTENEIKISADISQKTFEKNIIEVQIRLQRPFVDVARCIGCGICEHECPVSGRKAVRVSAEGQTRDGRKSLLPA